MNIAGSSNGRMRLSESRHLGSNPSPVAKKCAKIVLIYGDKKHPR